MKGSLEQAFAMERARLAAAGSDTFLSIAADAVACGDVPGASAPNPGRLSAGEILGWAQLVGRSPQVASLDFVDIKPR